MKRLGLVVLCALAAVPGAAANTSPPGSRDPGFTDLPGRATFSIGQHDDAGYGVATQKDGKIVVVGSSFNGANLDFALARFNPDGSIDTTFSSDGRVTTAFGGGDDVARAVAIQKDGGIVVAGSSVQGGHAQIVVARYLPNGSLDPSFSGDGSVVVPVGTDDEADAVAVGSNGSIVAAGTATLGSHELAVVRLTKAGAVDPTFNGSGWETTAVGTSAAGHAVALVGSSIVVAGSAFTGTDDDFAVVRYLKNGVLDQGFGTSGIRIVQVGPGNDEAFAIAPGKSGALFVAGGTAVGGGEQFAVAKLDSSGVLGAGWGLTGVVKTSISGTSDEAHGVAVLGDGSVVAGGRTGGMGTTDFALVKYTPGGALDPSFASGGIASSGIGSTDDVPFGLALAGKSIVLAGWTDTGTKLDFAVAEYRADGSYALFSSRPGIVQYGVGAADSQLWDAAVQADGKIVAVGSYDNGSNTDLIVTRMNPDGSVDGTFGFFGFAAVAFGSGNDQGYAIAVQPDGKIVVAGSAVVGGLTRTAIARLLPSGAPDNTFDGDGQATTLVGTDGSLALDVALQPDGKIVLAGMEAIGLDTNAALVRYNANGSLDTSFDGDGKANTQIGTAGASAQALVIQPDGKIITCGHTWDGSYYDLAYARFDANGSLDTSWGTNGKTIWKLASQAADHQCTGLQLMKDGSLFSTGTLTITGFGSGADIVKLTKDGKPDSAFTPTGATQVTFASSHVANATGIFVDSKGRIVVAGTGDTGNGTPAVFAIGRLLKSHYYDLSFGGGMVKTAFPGSAGDHAHGFTVMPDGSFLLVGSTDRGSHHEFALARYRP